MRFCDDGGIEIDNNAANAACRISPRQRGLNAGGRSFDSADAA
jgi:hypothetical protein